jgi:hypothetical protein
LRLKGGPARSPVGHDTANRTQAGRWTITFCNPPINMFVPTTIVELEALMTEIEADSFVKVVVFQSANPDFFVAHLDVAKAAERPEVLGLWREFVLRLASAAVVSIARIRGRTRGIGIEFALACDMRFASRQKAIFGNPEVGVGLIPGGRALEWLPRLTKSAYWTVRARRESDTPYRHPKKRMTPHLLAILVLGLMCGSELNVGVFAHPALNGQTIDVHVPVRAALAKLLGRVMPFWMATSTLLNLFLLLSFEGLREMAWSFAAIAAGIQVSAVLFSVIFPVPINNRIMRWTPATVPQDWRAQEHRWDGFHAFRTLGLIGSFVLLTLSLAVR